jgi:hypothetical protein
MSEPQRLLDGSGGLELELLRSAKDDGPSTHARRRTMVALGIGTGIVGVGVTTAGSTAASTGVGGILKWIGIGVVGGGLAVGGAQEAMHLSTSRTQISMAVKGQEQATDKASRPARAYLARLAEPPKAVEPAAAEVPEVADEALPEPEKVDAPLAARPVTRRANGASLADEVAQLDRAREALHRGDLQQALEMLEQHDQQFGRALLGPEAMVLRIEALTQNGDKAGAAALANQFLAAYPTSPAANRVRSLLAGAVSGPASSP